MSKTRKTRPYWVKLLDNPNYMEPGHSIECKSDEAPCDLPPSPLAQYYMDHNTKCCWTPTGMSYNNPENRCGCHLCTQY